MPVVLRGMTAFDDIVLAVCMVIVVIILLLPWLSSDVALWVKKTLKLPAEAPLPLWLLGGAFFLIFICFYLLLHGL